MPYDENTADRVRRALARRRDVVEKKMMGGLAFMIGGGMGCYLSRKGYFLIRVTEDGREQTLAMTHVKPTEFAGRRMSGFVLIEPDGYRTDAALAKWVQHGIDNALARGASAAEKRRTSKAGAKKAPATRSARAGKRARQSTRAAAPRRRAPA